MAKEKCRLRDKEDSHKSEKQHQPKEADPRGQLKREIQSTELLGEKEKEKPDAPKATKALAVKAKAAPKQSATQPAKAEPTPASLVKEPSSPTKANAVLSCLQRQSTVELNKGIQSNQSTPARASEGSVQNTPSSKESEKSHNSAQQKIPVSKGSAAAPEPESNQEDSSSDEDSEQAAKEEEKARARREAHARYMRFSRSLTSTLSCDCFVLDLGMGLCGTKFTS